MQLLLGMLILLQYHRMPEILSVLSEEHLYERVCVVLIKDVRLLQLFQ
jgi:hypothetical protein